MARWLQFPAADGSAAFPQDGRGHFLKADHGAEFFLDRQPGQFVATPLLGGKEQFYFAVFHASYFSVS